MRERATATDKFSAGVDFGPSIGELVKATGRYVVECYGKDGKLKWRDTIENVITTVGKSLIATGAVGNAAQGAVVMGLKGTGSAVAGDTQASHAGWLEVGLANAPTYSGNRKTPTLGAATGGVISTSSASTFSMTGSGTVAGAFINVGGSATIDNTTGTLLSAGNFTQGDKIVTSGDTINVSWSLTIS